MSNTKHNNSLETVRRGKSNDIPNDLASQRSKLCIKSRTASLMDSLRPISRLPSMSKSNDDYPYFCNSNKKSHTENKKRVSSLDKSKLELPFALSDVSFCFGPILINY